VLGFEINPLNIFGILRQMMGLLCFNSLDDDRKKYANLPGHFWCYIIEAISSFRLEDDSRMER